ncbi:hypothetical protein [Bradyrhizobium sp. CCBAU 51753]|uniref:hypothetical protein n=1 Tax=Bradyrhizobium sp. CCBAU 51753 TaxID=1325100 RepID=UPI00188B8978|nr:hypothetical protein [Bradyrhizobium sp. CCBAU 51753]QOZ24212.1 hypothetical protein XH93_12000 [Bradyrhizobium sp. CCBAU 51753]
MLICDQPILVGVTPTFLVILAKASIFNHHNGKESLAMKMAVWSVPDVFAAAVFTIGLFDWVARPFMGRPVRQMLSKV